MSRALALANLTTSSLSRKHASRPLATYFVAHNASFLHRSFRSSGRQPADQPSSCRDTTHQAPDESSSKKAENDKHTTHGIIDCDTASTEGTNSQGGKAPEQHQHTSVGQDGGSANIAKELEASRRDTPSARSQGGSCHVKVVTEAEARRASLARSLAALRDR
jgi:hypothetical protein